MKKISMVAVVECDADVDDVIAVVYLYNHAKNYLNGIVLDPIPTTPIGKERAKKLENMGITIFNEIPDNTDVIFNGGAMTKIAQYLSRAKKDGSGQPNTLKYLIMNGGFVGNNIVTDKDTLPKFKGKNAVPTFNFNMDIPSTERVLKTPEHRLNHIILVGKNVCHSDINTEDGLWKDEKSICKEWNAKPDKKQHDMLAYHEGLAILTDRGEIDTDVTSNYCNFIKARPFNIKGDQSKYTKWGSTTNSLKSNFRECLVAISYSKD